MLEVQDNDDGDYVIVTTGAGWSSEEVDSADTEEEAEYLLREYTMAFGGDPGVEIKRRSELR